MPENGTQRKLSGPESLTMSGPAKFFLLFGGWTLFGLFFSFQSIVSNAYFGRPPAVGRNLVSWLVCAYLWALVTPIVVNLAGRFPLEKGCLARHLAIHLPAALAVSVLQLTIYVLVWEGLLGDAQKPFSFVKPFQNLLVVDLHINFLLYATVVGLTQAAVYYRRFRERERRAAELELEAAQLETQLARAQLDALKMQLHPHFLFNTLNTISVLMQEDVEAANRMLLRLSDLLRLALKNTGTHEVSLRQELEFLQSYLEIEQTRFQDRLEVEFNVGPDTLDARVPNLILQPLVENAIRHAVAPRAEKSVIRISAARENGDLKMSVRDDGAGLDEKNGNKKGIGLANTRARLEKLYGAGHKFELLRVAAGGLEATIRIPFRPAGDDHD